MKPAYIIKKFKECEYRINETVLGDIVVYTAGGYGCKSFPSYETAFNYYFRQKKRPND